VAAEPAGDLQSSGARQAVADLPANGSTVERISRVSRSQRFVDGVTAVKAIDWDAVQRFGPIPRLMLAREATNAVDAGFAQEWFEHSIGVASELRSVIEAKSPADAQLISRLFCNTEGCLCYLEDEEGDPLKRPTHDILISLQDASWAQDYGIKPLTFYRFGTKSWDLILIARPK
jgi:hypothetical protein